MGKHIRIPSGIKINRFRKPSFDCSIFAIPPNSGSLPPFHSLLNPAGKTEPPVSRDPVSDFNYPNYDVAFPREQQAGKCRRHFPAKWQEFAEEETPISISQSSLPCYTQWKMSAFPAAPALGSCTAGSQRQSHPLSFPHEFSRRPARILLLSYFKGINTGPHYCRDNVKTSLSGTGEWDPH